MNSAKNTQNTTNNLSCHCEARSNPLSPNANGLPHSTPLRSQWQTHHHRPSHGFTLVELIVVITILTILGTIAFTQLGGFAGSARDSARISNLTNLKKWLDIFQIKSGTYPMPKNSVNITASGTTIGYQGFAKEQIEGIAKLSPEATKDPSDATMFTTYSVNLNQSKMQAMVFLEDNSTLTAFVPNASSLWITQTSASTTSDYSKRYPTTQWDPLGILLSSTGITLNQPVQETGTGLDIIASTGGLYKAYVTSTNIISGTGTIFIPLLTNYDSTIGTFPGCDTKDIKLPNGQVWAACNMGATTAYTNQSLTNCAGWATDCDASLRSTIGSYYQWGRNDDVTLQGTPTATPAIAGTLAGGVGHSNFITNAASPYDWIATQNDNLWGGAGTTSTAGTYSSQWSPSAMQGPCPAGYHVPTQFEWCSVARSINPALTCTSAWQNDTSLATTLNLPLSGYRDYSTAGYSGQGVNGYYWSSSPSGVYGYVVYISGTQVFPLSGNNRSYGFGVRCLKN